MKKIILFSLSASIILMSSCATVFMPKKQKVTITTNNKDAKIFLDKEEIGKGTSVTLKVKKEGSHQIVVQTPGYKDTYACLIPTHRAPAYWALEAINVATIYGMYYGLILDSWNPKNMSYEKITHIPIEDKIVNRTPADKFIEISNIKLDVKNEKKDIILINVDWKADLAASIKEAEKKQKEAVAKAEMKEFKKNKKKKKGATLKEDNEVKSDDIIFSENVYKTLKKSGFIDTVNKIFSDNNNTLVLEGAVKKITFYNIIGKRQVGSYQKVKLDLVWYIKNTFNEKIDSVVTQQMSGDFNVYSAYYQSVSTKGGDNADNLYSKMFADAIDISYLNLHKNANLTKYIKQDKNFTISDPVLTMVAPKSAIADKGDAALASVIVKTSEGHGSGFAITQDGYIITNYHVIAGKIINKPLAVKIITSTGEELEGKIVRYNKYRDLALIKVDKTFEKAFKVNNVKTFKNLQDVYTIGAPKSIELGQSVSSGVISNERKNNNNYLLQLGMSVNGGNSGGPLFDNTGALHGVIVSKLVGQNTEGVAFAIPAHMIQEYLNIKY